jgi:hypothetical protein
MEKQDREEFRAYCRGVSDKQVIGVWEKETSAGRRAYAAIAAAEAERRGLELPR